MAAIALSLIAASPMSDIDILFYVVTPLRVYIMEDTNCPEGFPGFWTPAIEMGVVLSIPAAIIGCTILICCCPVLFPPVIDPA